MLQLWLREFLSVSKNLPEAFSLGVFNSETFCELNMSWTLSIVPPNQSKASFGPLGSRWGEGRYMYICQLWWYVRVITITHCWRGKRWPKEPWLEPCTNNLIRWYTHYVSDFSRAICCFEAASFSMAAEYATGFMDFFLSFFCMDVQDEVTRACCRPL